MDESAVMASGSNCAEEFPIGAALCCDFPFLTLQYRGRRELELVRHDLRNHGQ
jgi:hypothetical protein